MACELGGLCCFFSARALWGTVQGLIVAALAVPYLLLTWLALGLARWPLVCGQALVSAVATPRVEGPVLRLMLVCLAVPLVFALWLPCVAVSAVFVGVFYPLVVAVSVQMTEDGEGCCSGFESAASAALRTPKDFWIFTGRSVVRTLRDFRRPNGAVANFPVVHLPVAVIVIVSALFVHCMGGVLILLTYIIPSFFFPTIRLWRSWCSMWDPVHSGGGFIGALCGCCCQFASMMLAVVLLPVYCAATAVLPALGPLALVLGVVAFIPFALACPFRAVACYAGIGQSWRLMLWDVRTADAAARRAYIGVLFGDEDDEDKSCLCGCLTPPAAAPDQPPRFMVFEDGRPAGPGEPQRRQSADLRAAFPAAAAAAPAARPPPWQIWRRRRSEPQAPVLPPVSADTIWDAFFASAIQLGKVAAERGVITPMEIHDSEPFLFVGLPSEVVYNCTAFSAGMHPGVDIIQVTVDTAVTAAVVPPGPLAGPFFRRCVALKQAVEAAKPSEVEENFLRGHLLTCGNYAEPPGVAPGRRSELMRLASLAQSLGYDLSRQPQFHRRFDSVLEELRAAAPLPPPPGLLERSVAQAREVTGRLWGWFAGAPAAPEQSVNRERLLQGSGQGANAL